MPPQSSRHVDKTVVASPKVVAAVAGTDTTSGKLHFKKVYRSGDWSQNTPPSLGGIRRGRGHITHCSVVVQVVCQAVVFGSAMDRGKKAVLLKDNEVDANKPMGLPVQVADLELRKDHEADANKPMG